MNIEKLKQFVSLAQELTDEGVLGLRYFFKEFHINKKALLEMEDIQIEKRNDHDFPYQIFVMVDGIKLYALAKAEDIKHLPQFKAFLKADLLRQIEELEEEALA